MSQLSLLGLEAAEANNMEVIPPTAVWEGLKQAMLTDKQIVLVNTVETYADVLRSKNPVLADPTYYGIRHIYFLLRAQAINDRNPS